MQEVVSSNLIGSIPGEMFIGTSHANAGPSARRPANLRPRTRVRGSDAVSVWLLLALAGCGLGQYDDYAPLTVFDNFRTIASERAYRSAQLDAETLRLVIDRYGIRTIFNLRGENEDQRWYQNERVVAAETGTTLVDVGMSANTLPSRDVLLKLYDTFQTAEYPILIHCQAGSDRTGAAAAIWRMVFNGEAPTAALTELSPLYGHFETVHPDMDRLVRMFEPERAWIEHEYPEPG